MKGLYTIKLFLVLLMVVVLAQNQPEGKDAQEKPDEPKQDTDTTIILDEMRISLEDVLRQNRWGRNPFLPYNHLNTETVDNHLREMETVGTRIDEIFRQDGRYKAKVQNRTLKEGDPFLDMTVAYIGESIVIFSRQNDALAALSWKKIHQ